MIQPLCDCGSQVPYDECCGPLLSGKSKANSPEQLMRSRFSAFCKKNIQYLMDTRHPSKREPDDRESLNHTMNETQWLGLKIIKTSKNKKDEGTGQVEFAAFYKAGDFGQLHERSTFIRENKSWFYLDGQMLEPVKTGRNEPCWCNSGKKYKKCHG